MSKDQKRNTRDASGADGNGTSAEKILAQIEPNSDPNIRKQLNKSQRSLPISLSKTKKEAALLQDSIEKENERILQIPKEEIINEIMLRLEADAQGQGVGNIDMEDLHTVGVCLIRNLCSFEAAALELGMSPARLKNLVIHDITLQEYYKIAHSGIKSITDKQIIRGLKEGDPNVVKMVFNKMYAGRNKGGYNIAELGTTGYDDPIAQQLAAATEDDRRQSQVKVEFNFVKKEVRQSFGEIESVDNIVDGEYEMVGDENENKDEGK